MKSSKLDAARNNPVNGVAGPTEAGALFPRVHVSETEKAGPRAPPRNKMALFEQFTVPLHRFMQSQPNTISLKPLNQPQKIDSGHSYFAYCTPASHANAVPPHPQSLHVASSCVTSIASDQVSQKTSCSTSEKRSLSGVTIKFGSLNTSMLLEEKANDILDEIQESYLPTVPIKMQESLCTPSSFEKICDKFASASCESAQVPITTMVQNDTSEAKSIGKNEGLAILAAKSRGYGHAKADVSTGMDIADAVQTERATIQIDAVDTANELCHGCSTFELEQSCQQPDPNYHKVLNEGLAQRHEPPEVASTNDLDTHGSIGGHTSSPSRNCLADSIWKSSSRQVPDSLHVCRYTRISRPSGGEKRDASRLAEVILKDKCENIGDSENNHMCSNDVSKLSQHGTGKNSDDSLSSASAVRSIKPKDVIRTVGQQQFWKARKSLLRQQRIFSDQVFELHKLIKVQQLLVDIPGTLLDEETAFGIVDQYEGSPPRCIAAEVEKSCNETTHLTTSLKQLSSKGQGNIAGNEPGRVQNSQWYVGNGNNMPGSMPYLPVFPSNGIGAWGYPSFGMGQWMGAFPVQGRPSVYQPYAGAFPPPYGGLYGPAGLGSPSSVMPFCIPYTAQTGESWEGMGLNHGLPVAAAGPDLLSGPAALAAQNLPGACQFLHPSCNPIFYAGAPEKNASAGSGASISPRRQVKLPQVSGTELPPCAVGAVRRLNNKGPEITIPQNGKYPHTSTNLKSRSSVSMQSVSGSRIDGSYHHQTTGEVAQKSMSSFHLISSPTKQDLTNQMRGRREGHCGGLTWPRCQQGEQVSCTNGGLEDKTGPPPEQCSNALNLFPMVPSVGNSGGQSRKQIYEEWHGRVIKAVPHPAVAASQSAAGILLSLQRERRQ